jgi:hypothetical protein
VPTTPSQYPFVTSSLLKGSSVPELGISKILALSYSL